MNDVEMDAKLDELWHKWISAVQRDAYDEARAVMRQMHEITCRRTPAQWERALRIAGMTADGRCAHLKITNNVCDKCGGVVEGRAA